MVLHVFLSNILVGPFHGILDRLGCRSRHRVSMRSLMSVKTTVLSSMSLIAFILGIVSELDALLSFFFGERLDDLHASILVNELVNIHVTSADANNQFSIDDLGHNLFGTEHVLSRSQPDNLDLTAEVRSPESFCKHDVDWILLVCNIVAGLRLWLLSALIFELRILVLEVKHLRLETLASRSKLLDFGSVTATDGHIVVDLIHAGIIVILLFSLTLFECLSLTHLDR